MPEWVSVSLHLFHYLPISSSSRHASPAACAIIIIAHLPQSRYSVAAAAAAAADRHHYSHQRRGGGGCVAVVCPSRADRLLTHSAVVCGACARVPKIFRLHKPLATLNDWFTFFSDRAAFFPLPRPHREVVPICRH